MARAQILIYICLAAIGLAWIGRSQPSTPGTPSACAGGVTVLLNGAPLSTGCVLNIKAGDGIIATPAANPAISGTDLSFTANTAVIQSVDNAEAGLANFCGSTNGTTAYTCALANKALAAYSVGMHVLLRADTTSSGACSLNINGLGVHSIKQNDGTTDPAAGQIVAGRFYWLFFDGTVFRLQ